MNDTLSRVLRKFNLDASADYSQKAMPLNLPHFSRNDLAALFGELGFKTGAEIGVETGLYSEVLCKANPRLTELLLVDPWKAMRGYRDHVSQEKLDGFLERAKARLAGLPVRFDRQTSMHAANLVNPDQLDFVYIDANHRFNWVMRDILEWSDRVRAGGIVAGHDYIRPKNNHECKQGVIEAVNAYTQGNQLTPWFVTRGDDPKAPSWFWVKP